MTAFQPLHKIFYIYDEPLTFGRFMLLYFADFVLWFWLLGLEALSLILVSILFMTFSKHFLIAFRSSRLINFVANSSLRKIAYGTMTESIS